MPEFNLNRWEQAAKTAEEKPARKRCTGLEVREQRTKPGTVSATLPALSREEVARMGGHFPGVARPVEKSGVDVAAGGALRSQWISITPQMAAAWLKNNFRNRPVKQDTVSAYARDMRRGRWKRTHQGIAFNDRDELIDGQHRLLAIVECGCTVEMMVTFGLPSKTEGQDMTVMDCVDRGAPRSVADQLVIQHGMKHGRAVAMVCATLGVVCHGERTRRLSVGETLEIYREFEAPMDFVIAHRSKASGLKMAGVLAAFAFARAGGWKAAEALYLSLVSGKMTAPALVKLHAFLTSPESALLMRSHDRGLVELCLQALYIEKEGIDPKHFAVKIDGRDHFRALQPERVEKVKRLFQV